MFSRRKIGNHFWMPMSRFCSLFLGEDGELYALSDREINIFGYIVDGYQKKRYAKNIALGNTILNWEGRKGFVSNTNHY